MTREEAMKAVKEGNKVAHRFFSKDEYVTTVNGKLVDEQGYHFGWLAFWGDRKGGAWETDWFLVISHDY